RLRRLAGRRDECRGDARQRDARPLQRKERLSSAALHDRHLPRGGGILPEASREGRAPEIVFITRLAKDRMTMDQTHPGRRRDDENPGMSSSGCRTLENDATQARSQEKSLPREKFPPSSRRRRPIAGRRVRIKIRSRLLLNQVYFAWRSSMGHTCSCWVAADESAGSLGVKCSRQEAFPCGAAGPPSRGRDRAGLLSRLTGQFFSPRWSAGFFTARVRGFGSLNRSVVHSLGPRWRGSLIRRGRRRRQVTGTRTACALVTVAGGLQLELRSITRSCRSCPAAVFMPVSATPGICFCALRVRRRALNLPSDPFARPSIDFSRRLFPFASACSACPVCTFALVRILPSPSRSAPAGTTVCTVWINSSSRQSIDGKLAPAGQGGAAPSSKPPPLPGEALLSAMVTLVNVAIASKRSLAIPPPRSADVFPLTVTLVSVAVSGLSMPPPKVAAVLPLTTQSVRVRSLTLERPPPPPAEVLLATTTSVHVRVPWLSTP